MIKLLEILIDVLAVLSVAFVVIYGLGSPWYRTAVGQHLFVKGVVLAGLMIFQVWSIYIGPVPIILWVIGLTAFIGALTWRIVLVILAQRTNRDWFKEK